MLQQSEGTLNDNVLQDGSGRNINGAAFCSNNDNRTLESDTTTEVDSASDGQMVKFDHLWDATNTLLEVGDLLEIVSELNERSWTETAGVNL